MITDRFCLSLLACAAVVGVASAAAPYAFTVTTNDTVVSVDYAASTNHCDQLTTTFLAPDVSRVVYDMNGEVVYVVPDGTPTYADGTHVKSGQVRIRKGDALGTGPILLGDGNAGAALVADASVVVTNKIIFSNDVVWAMSAGPSLWLTVQRLAGGIGAHGARFGRSNAPSRLALDLAEDEGNEPMSCIAFRGDTDGTLGGVMKATAAAKSPFLRNTQSGFSQHFEIARSGLIVDAAEGADFRLTTEVCVTNPPEIKINGPVTVVPENASFEEGNGNWTSERIDSGSGASCPGVVDNTDATWVKSRVTTFGQKVMALRTGHRLTSPEIEIPFDGAWRLNFWRVGREGYSGASQDTDVTFANCETGETVTQTLAPMGSDTAYFQQTVTPGFALTAGRYKFSLYPKCKNSTATMLYDNFAVEEAERLVYPEGGDFESGNAPGWTFVNIDSRGSQIWGVQTNGNAYSPSRPTPFGTHAVMLRNGNQMTSPEFEIPSDGDWRLTFWRVGRQGNSGIGAETDVVLIDSNGVALTNVVAGATDTSAYQLVQMQPLSLKAGSFRFAIHPHATSQEYSCMFYDRFVIEKVDFEHISGGAPVTKRGAGRMIMPAQDYTNPFVVEGGVLAFQGAAFDGVQAQATGTGCLELGPDTTVDAASVLSVAPGAALRLTDIHENLVQNGSFEVNDLAGGTVLWRSGSGLIADWLISCVTPNGNNGKGGDVGGVQANGGAITPNGPNTPYGTYTVAVREHCQVAQTVTVVEEGDYVLSFVYAMRKDYGTATAAQVRLGEMVVASLPKNQNEFRRVTEKIHLTPGAYPLVFHVNEGVAASGGPMLLVDDVSLRKQGALPTWEGAIDLVSGSTLDLRNIEPIVLKLGALTVDGRPVQGKRRSLESAGVTVVGDGQIRIGDPLGMMIIIR